MKIMKIQNIKGALTKLSQITKSIQRGYIHTTQIKQK